MGAKPTTRKIGARGESICTDYLISRGFKIIRRNWVCRWGEIDIIANDHDELVFIEVKTVTCSNYCNAKDLFSPAKRRKLLRSIHILLLKKKIKITRWRLDLVCITKDRNRVWIEHYKNVLAF